MIKRLRPRHRMAKVLGIPIERYKTLSDELAEKKRRAQELEGEVKKLLGELSQERARDLEGEVKKLLGELTEQRRLELDWLKRGRTFRTLIDIGANDGRYGEYLRSVFGVSRAIAFEPLPTRTAELRSRGFEVHPVALGRERRTAPLIVNRLDATSSLRRLTDAHRREFPEAVEGAEIDVEVVSLDECLPDELERDLVIKVDAQGSEADVIDGGRKVFAQASVVLIETGFVPLFSGEGLFGDTHARLSALGFHLAGVKNQHRGKDGRPLFAHCIYER
jgi:FkbM family methyltransferase